MIKNLVFDFGQVLYKFEPSHLVGKYVSDKNDAAMLEKVIFSRKYWDRLDAGTITDEEVKIECQKELPTRLHEKSDLIYDHWIDNMPPVDGMEDLIKEIKSKFGVKLFVLSNISSGFADRSSEFEVLSHFDACIFSARCKMTKPNREIFDYLCVSNGLVPDETLFIDDSEININGACQYGIHGYLFDGNTAKLKKYLYAILTEKI